MSKKHMLLSGSIVDIKRSGPEDKPHVLYELAIGNPASRYVGFTAIEDATNLNDVTDAKMKRSVALITRHMFNLSKAEKEHRMPAVQKAMRRIPWDQIRYTVLDRAESRASAVTKRRRIILRRQPELNNYNK